MSDEDDPNEPPILRHPGRRVSIALPANARLGQPIGPPTETQQERGAGIFRRLSLGTPFGRPAVPQPPGDAPKLHQPAPSTRVPGLQPPVVIVKPRAPSPMGERMLKGHFDGF